MVARTRRGTTLVELLAALPLLAVLVIVIALLTLDSNRVSRQVDGTTSRLRELRQASATIAMLLRPLRSTDIRQWSDTLVEFNAHSAFGIVCGQPASDHLYLLPANGNDPLRTSWSSAPSPGNSIEFDITTEDPTATPVTHHATITGVGTVVSGCASSVLRNSVGGNVVRIDIAPAAPAAAAIGSAARILEPTRLSLYRTGSEWFIGLKRRTTTGWETVQPIAGPFASAADNGMKLTILNRSGEVLAEHLSSTPPDSSSLPASIQLLLRAQSAWKRGNGSRDSDSLLTTIALRHP